MSIQSTSLPNSDCAPLLKAKTADWMRALLEEKELIKKWVSEFGSPLHVVVKDEFFKNVDCLLRPLKERNIEGNLFFARKANKLSFFVEAAKQAGIGVDTASITELKETIELGLSAEKIILTAIGKDETLLNTAIDHDCLIVIENEDELALLKQLAASRTKTIKIGLRFAGFETEEQQIYSRFGLNFGEHRSIIDGISNSNLNIKLLHAHIDRYDTTERAMAARQLIIASRHAKSLGHECDAIDLGGGILMRYLEHEEHWTNFQNELIAAVKGERKPFTFKGDGLGYFLAAGKLAGHADFYPAWNSLYKENFIAAILDHKHKDSLLHEEIKAAKLRLYFEPGRALLDNCGITFANVAFRKKDTLNQKLIGLRMNRMNLRPFRAEFCSDPVILCFGAREKAQEGAYLVGCLCSESDTIFRRKFFFDEVPEPGDIFAFINSAGYLSHHMEIGTHGDPVPTNILVEPGSWMVQGQAL